MNNKGLILKLRRMGFGLLISLTTLSITDLHLGAGSKNLAQSVSTSSAETVTNGVNYAGVRFSFEPSLADEVRPETISASVEGQPCDIWPEHTRFSFIGYPLSTLQTVDAHLSVFDISRFRNALSKAGATEHPNDKVFYRSLLDKEMRVLQSLLSTQPSKQNIGQYLARMRKEEGCHGSMPFLPFKLACQAFATRVNYVKFKGGRGVLFLTQWDTETKQVANPYLEFAFQGITDDGKTYISAEFPVSAAFLPNDDAPAVMAWNEENYLLSHRSKQYLNYLRPLMAKLETRPATDFAPKLDLLEQLVASLEVQTK
jgi:hypothetical protein